MPPNNPYIQKVLCDPNILTNTDEIYSHKGNWNEYFKNTNPLVLEIGTGMGNFFGKQVAEHPDTNFIGMEIRYKRLFQTAEKSRKSKFLSLAHGATPHPAPLPKGEGKNYKLQPHLLPLGEEWGGGFLGKKLDRENFVMLKDFGQNIDKIFQAEEVAETYIFFPDPWANKDRQRKHRLLQEIFLEKLFHITQTGGKLYFKTDHQEYFDSTKEIIEIQNLWTIQQWTNNYENSEIFDMNNITEFEGFYRGENTHINYLELVK